VAVVEREEQRNMRVRHLERLPLGAPYVRVVSRASEIMQHPALAEESRLVVDATGGGGTGGGNAAGHAACIPRDGGYDHFGRTLEWARGGVACSEEGSDGGLAGAAGERAVEDSPEAA
jgi:hypothetical protein